MDKVSAMQPQEHGFKSQSGHHHDSTYDNRTGCQWLVPGSRLESNLKKWLELA